MACSPASTALSPVRARDSGADGEEPGRPSPAGARERASRAAMVLRKAVFVQLLPRDLLEPGIPLGRARELFAQYVDLVEIENHSFCNRVCWFCPNSYLDRRRSNTILSSAVYTRILDDLCEIDYAQTLSWSRYHEVLAESSVYGRIAEARRRLPRASLVAISNGDYLKRDTLARLEAAGLDRLILDLYLPPGRERDARAVAAGLRRFQRRTATVLEEDGPYDYRVPGTRMKVTLEVPHYTEENISTRAGLVQVPKLAEYRRRAVCLAPVRHVVVDYNGKGMLCCQTRSDAAGHRGAVIGELDATGYGLFHLYRDLGAARRALLAPGEKGGVCSTCDVRDDGPDKLARREVLARALERLPGSHARAERWWRRFLRRSSTASATASD